MTRLRPLLVLSFVALTLTACARRSVVREVAVEPTAGGALPVSVSHRHYRNLLRIAGRDLRCHPDRLLAQEPSPGIFSVHGCGMVRDYVMVCRHRRRCRWHGIPPVEQVAMMESGCRMGPAQLAITGPLTRQVTVCGQSIAYALACGPMGCGWSRGAVGQAVVMQTDPGTSVIVVADEDGAHAPEPAVADGDEVIDLGAPDTLQALLATQIAAIRACTQGQSVTLTLRWAADGTVSVGLAPPYAGSPIEACVQRAVGTVRIQAQGGSGEIRATL